MNLPREPITTSAGMGTLGQEKALNCQAKFEKLGGGGQVWQLSFLFRGVLGTILSQDFKVALNEIYGNPRLK